MEEPIYIDMDDSDVEFISDSSMELSNVLEKPLKMVGSAMFQCSQQSLDSVKSSFDDLLLIILVHRLIVLIPILPRWTKESCGVLLSFVLFHQWIQDDNMRYSIVSVVVLLSICIMQQRVKYKGHITLVICLLLIHLLEYFIDLEMFASTRGCLMIFSMKLIAMAYSTEEKLADITLLQSLGYVFHPASLMFGPFLTYKDYENMYVIRMNVKNVLHSFLQSFICMVMGYIFLAVSSCNVLLFVALGVGFDYSTALSFRMSHYFISYVSDAALWLSGIPSVVVNPLKVEFPRSILDVCRYWNLPMHHFLHNYIYCNLRFVTPRWLAIIITFVVSGMLHGSSFQLMGCLIGLAMYGVSESFFRKFLSIHFDACVKSNRCDGCLHSKTEDNSNLVKLINWFFTILAIYMLVYLGMPFTGNAVYTWNNSIQAYSTHHFLGHYITVFLTLPVILLKITGHNL